MADVQETAVDELLARAVVYCTLSVAFQAPTAHRLTRIGAHDHFSIVTSALRRLGLLDAILEALPASAIDAAPQEYWRLFGHTTRGQICPCETEYGPDNGFHQPQQLADISGYYLAFGLRFGVDADVRADHIASECEFMDFLSRKEALLSSDSGRGVEADETLEATRQAARSFLRDHLGRFGCAFGARLAAEDPDGYYGAFGRVLLMFLQAECDRLGVRSGAIDLAVRAEVVDDAPMACGSGDELIQIQRRHP